MFGKLDARQDDKYRQWYHFDAEGKTLGHLAKAGELESCNLS